MPYVEYPRVEESLVVLGTGAVTTGSTPVSGAQTFADVATIGDTFPLWIVDTTTSPPTIESSLGTYTAANTITRTGTLVSFLGNACSVFIARIPGGNAAQTFEVANASTGTQAVALGQAQADFIGSGNFLLANSVDLNTIGKSGFYNIEGIPVNAPLGIQYAPMIVVNPGGQLIQILAQYNKGVLWSRGYDGTSAVWSPWVQTAVTQNDNNFLVPQTLPAATAAGHAVNLGQAQADFAPILTVNAPVDRLAALDALATLYTNPGPTLWVDSIVAGAGAVAITVNAVLVATLAAGTAISITTPPGGTIQLDTTLPATWFRTTM